MVNGVKNKADLDELMERISKCVGAYERRNYDNIVFNLYLDSADNTKLSICFGRENIAHMLGIDTDYLKSTGCYKNSSYGILKEICNDSYRLYDLERSGHLSYSSFISDYAFTKVDNFANVCGINIFNIVFVCEYSKEQSYITGFPQLEGDYYIAYKNGDGLSVAGFKKNGNYYYPMTNMCLDLDDEKSKTFLKTLLTGQIVTLPSCLNLYYRKEDSKGKNIYINYYEKAIKLRKLSTYCKEYGCIADVSKGYLFILEKLFQSFDSKNNMYPLMESICSSMRQRLPIDIQEFSGLLPDDIIHEIEEYNSNINVEIKNAMDAYTKKIEEERDTLKKNEQRQIKELERLKQQLVKCKEEKDALEKRNKELLERQSAYDSAIDEATKAFMRIKTKAVDKS